MLSPCTGFKKNDSKVLRNFVHYHDVKTQEPGSNRVYQLEFSFETKSFNSYRYLEREFLKFIFWKVSFCIFSFEIVVKNYKFNYNIGVHDNCKWG